MQVTWDEPDLLQGVSRVSPWQVELVATLPMQLPPFSLPKKKLRAVQPQELQLQAPGLLGLPLACSSTFSGQLPAPWGGPALLDDVSAGMQGARHDRFNGLLTMDFRNSNYKHPREYPSENYYNEQVPPVRALLSDSPSGNNHHFSLLPNGQHRSQHSVSSSHTVGFMPAGSSQGENTATKATSTSFFLFGQSIDPTSNTKPQQQCVTSGNSSSDGPLLHDGLRVSTTSNSSSDNTFENKDRMRRFHSRHNGASGVTGDGAMSRYRQNDSGHWCDLSIGSEVGSLKWFKDQATDREKGFNEALHHCKVFKEGDEVGRTLDLSNFNSYDEIYDRLAAMFCVPVLDFKNRLVYQSAEGFTKHVGVEPYRYIQTTSLFPVNSINR